MGTPQRPYSIVLFLLPPLNNAEVLNKLYMVHLLLQKSRFLQRIKRGIQYTNPHSETVQIIVFFANGMLYANNAVQCIYYFMYMGVHKKGSGDVVSAVCVQIGRIDR